MTRTMYDATSANAQALATQNPTMVARYITGSTSIQWTSTQVALFPTSVHWVTIDQAGAGAPNANAIVKDIEPGAYRPSDIPNFQFAASVQRPTVYCDRSDLVNGVIQAWSRDIWLAWPGWNGEAFTSLGITAAQAKQIVAVQNEFDAQWDKSVVVDANWPFKAPVFPSAPAPPGSWIKAAEMTGLGTDRNLYKTVYNPATGTWSSPVKLP